ncbi:DUF5615 family PIN-like protein [Polaribacter cellanae]|uniref:DUF5615 family PIN-like protein n=1 Tax=Polaribacter cellanae TaxID=2818493 RepID=A0A975CRA4_9FLAO|nr:DUF5615 family PIN-like protein [Polaribacter cellanae]QTE24168.1 DUF5615 family PIN-like protein [Polaribacter cellanae]
MKLLFDQNISFRILKQIDSYYPNSKQVRVLNLENASDSKKWEFAKENDFVIVTFDADFSDIANIKGNPPKILWLRTGNTSTKNIAKILKNRFEVISEFIQKEKYKTIAYLEINF